MSGTVAGWIAVGALAVALVALVVALAYWRALRRTRRAQTVLLGSGREDRPSRFTQTRIDDLHRAVDEIAAGRSSGSTRGWTGRSLARRSFASTPTRTSAVSSLRPAFLDAARSSVVLTAIQGRDYARIYVKELDRGHAPVGLSPEEREAVERAMAAV